MRCDSVLQVSSHMIFILKETDSHVSVPKRLCQSAKLAKPFDSARGVYLKSYILTARSAIVLPSCTAAKKAWLDSFHILLL